MSAYTSEWYYLEYKCRRCGKTFFSRSADISDPEYKYQQFSNSISTHKCDIIGPESIGIGDCIGFLQEGMEGNK